MTTQTTSAPTRHALPIAPVASLVAAMATETRDLYARRLERKLVLGPSAAAALREVVARHMAVEHFVAGRDRTVIHSIYFDTPAFALYHQAMLPGGATGLKLRIRAYGDAATPGVTDAGRFLEAKMAVSTAPGVREKNKARMPLADVALATLLGDRGDGPVFAPRARKRFWQPLLAFMALNRVAPRLCVSYTREAFVDATGGLRVTFDENYEASAITSNGASPVRKPATLPGTTILEIKFVGEVPAWLTDALVALSLPVEGESFSKYKTAVGLLFPAARAIAA